MRQNLAENLEKYVRRLSMFSIIHGLTAEEMGVPDEAIMQNPWRKHPDYIILRGEQNLNRRFNYYDSSKHRQN